MPKATRHHSVASASIDDDEDDLLLGRDSAIGESASSTNLIELHAQSTLLRRLDTAFSQPTSVGHTAVKQTPPLFELSSHILAQGVSAVVDDSFNRCFLSIDSDDWNWNVYLLPGWLVGLLIRYCIAFPLRLTALVLIFTASALFLGAVKVCNKDRATVFLCGHATSPCSLSEESADHASNAAGLLGKSESP
jgi:hypothetical protein